MQAPNVRSARARLSVAAACVLLLSAILDSRAAAAALFARSFATAAAVAAENRHRRINLFYLNELTAAAGSS